MNSHFPQVEICLADRHMIKCSSLHIIRKKQIKIMQYHLTSVPMVHIKRYGIDSIEGVVVRNEHTIILKSIDLGSNTLVQISEVIFAYMKHSKN